MNAELDSIGYRFLISADIRHVFLSDAEPGPGQDPYEIDPIVVITKLLAHGDTLTRNACTVLLSQHTAHVPLMLAKYVDGDCYLTHYAIATRGVQTVAVQAMLPPEPPVTPAPTRRLKFPKR